MKRLLDIGIILLFLPFVITFCCVTALFVRAVLGSPVLFRQERTGLNGSAFNMIKFRTMTNDTGPDGSLLSDGVRLTKFGRFLRSTSLDELPELWNVIKGDMSLVGPRPLLVEYLPLYNSEQERRHEVLPGITGWAQIHGRNAVSWNEKFDLDIWYVDNRSIWLDFKILFITIHKVLARGNVNHANCATVEKFNNVR